MDILITWLFKKKFTGIVLLFSGMGPNEPTRHERSKNNCCVLCVLSIISIVVYIVSSYEWFNK